MTNINTNLLISQAENMQILNDLYALQNILTAFVIPNYQLVNKSSQSITVTVTNANLFSLAVQYYSDVNYWPVIANANYLTDTKIPGTTTLIIPPKPTNDPIGVQNPTYSSVPIND
jgi:hypothetical protein